MHDSIISPNALKVLAARYLRKNEEGEVTETPEQMFARVAWNIAQADKNYGVDDEGVDDVGKRVEGVAQGFYDMMAQLDFLPNSPTLMNAGNSLQMLSACFVLGIEDTMESIFTTIKNTALIHKAGGGTGFSFSKLRPKGDSVLSTQGVSSGPISFMKVFDAATNVIVQGGKRRGANLGCLRVDHPDILDFITCKEDPDVLNNFNISVAITDKFMTRLKEGAEFSLVNPRTGGLSQKMSAASVFDLLVTMSWKNGEPGALFIDTIEKANPTPEIGTLESTNPCGETPLLSGEACNLGSINVANFIKGNDVDWPRLEDTIWKAVHFLDNVIDMNNYPLPEIEEASMRTRKVGLGLMGFADLLLQLGIKYDSEEGVVFAGKLMRFINDTAYRASADLAVNRGSFPAYAESVYKHGVQMRNATRTTIAPTGTISMIADTSSGIEPLFGIAYIKHVLDDTDFVYVNKHFEKIARDNGFYSEELMRKIAKVGSVQGLEEVPDEVKGYCVTAHDITPEWHVKMQAAFQRFTDNAISKTINFPHDATVEDVRKAYLLAYELSCKGITVYRDGSRDEQVLNIEKVNVKENICPECGKEMEMKEGCASCGSCGYSYCSVS